MLPADTNTKSASLQHTTQGGGVNNTKKDKKCPTFSKDNIMFLMMFVMSVVLCCSVGFYELYRSRNMLPLNSICTTGYCYYLDVSKLRSTYPNGLNTYAAVYNKLDYLKNIGVEVLIVNQVDLKSGDSDNMYLRKTLVQARKVGITVYMVIESTYYDLAINYINLGILGFVSNIKFCTGMDSCSAKDLVYVKTLVHKTQVPINGLILYLSSEESGSSVTSLVNDFDFVIMYFDTSSFNNILNNDNVNKIIFSPEPKYIDSERSTDDTHDRLIVLANLLVQPKCLIYAGLELGDSWIEHYTNDIQFTYTPLTALMSDFHTFRKNNNQFQQSSITFPKTTTNDFILYKRTYSNNDNAQKESRFYSIIKKKGGAASFTFNNLNNSEQHNELTIIYAYSISGGSSNMLLGKVLSKDDTLQIDENIILFIIKVE